MLILVALTATMMRPDVEGRRVREAARGINVYLASARNRATETGRPCGVIFRNFGAPGFAMNADQCEVPPSYAGDTEYAVAQIQRIPTDTVFNAFTGKTYVCDFQATLSEFFPGLVRVGDIIQFNQQGPCYVVAGPDILPDNSPQPSGDGIIDGSTVQLASIASQGQLFPWTTALSQPVPYRIFRAPMKGFAQPLQLPAATVVDLTASGPGIGVGLADFTVLFSPNGAVECIYIGAVRHSVVDPIYLLVGKRERVDNGYDDDNPNEDTLTNYQDLGNRWVTINPQTGAVQTEPVAAITSANFDEGKALGLTDEQAAARAARDLAREALGMGGK